MKHYQVSKYSDQEYDTWSAVTDIGNIYHNEVFSQEEYLRVEDLYVKFIEEFLGQIPEDFKVKFLMDLRGEDDVEKSLFCLDSAYIKIRGGEYLDLGAIVTASRLCLRDLMGIRLEADRGSYITFGNDFYLRIGVSDSYANHFEKLTINGLFIKRMDNDPDE